MINIILYILILTTFFSCKNPHQKSTIQSLPFDKTKWAIGTNQEYPYRDAMLPDFIEHYEIHGITKDSIIGLLGIPNRTDSGYLYYRIAQQKIGFFPLHTKTLVIKLNNDSLVEWRKIHQ